VAVGKESQHCESAKRMLTSLSLSLLSSSLLSIWMADSCSFLYVVYPPASWLESLPIIQPRRCIERQARSSLQLSSSNSCRISDELMQLPFIIVFELQSLEDTSDMMTQSDIGSAHSPLPGSYAA
jgi:hypothetical protein